MDWQLFSLVYMGQVLAGCLYVLVGQYDHFHGDPCKPYPYHRKQSDPSSDTHLFFRYARGRADHAPVLDATPLGLPLADGDLALEHRQLKKRKNKELHEVSVPGAAAASW